MKVSKTIFLTAIICLGLTNYFTVKKSGLLLSEQSEEIKKLERKIETKDEIICFLEEPTEMLIATVYHNKVKQTNSDNFHTASNFKLDSLDQYQHRIIAVSRDLIKKYPFGSKVFIKGTGKYDGVWTVQDKMNARYVKRIDLLINDGMSIGEWAVTIKIIK